MNFFLLWLALLPLVGFTYPMVPDGTKTPGELCSKADGDFSEYRYPARIIYCRRHVSAELKRQVYEDYGIAVKERDQYTIDHFYPLSMGGSNHRHNLWPEHHAVKALRPDLELELFEALQAGVKSQSEVLDEIREAKTKP